jgi:hypothetical protein
MNRATAFLLCRCRRDAGQEHRDCTRAWIAALHDCRLPGPLALHCNACNEMQRVQRCNERAAARAASGTAWLGQLNIPSLKQAAGRSPIFADRPGSPHVPRGTSLAQSTGLCWAPSSTWIALRAHTQSLPLTRPPVQESTAIVADPLGGNWRRAPKGWLIRNRPRAGVVPGAEPAIMAVVSENTVRVP